MRYLSIIIAASIGCSDDTHHAGDAEVNCAAESRADTYVAGMEAAGAAGLTARLLAAEPAPPARFANVWSIEIVDASQQSVADATVTVTPWMPDHGHGTPIETVVTNDAGTYTLNPVHLWMPGLWEIRIDAQAAAVSDRMTFRFCIDG